MFSTIRGITSASILDSEGASVLGPFDWYVIKEDGEHFKIESGDFLWIRSADGSLVFSGVFIRHVAPTFVNFVDARYSKAVFSTALGWSTESWAQLFAKFVKPKKLPDVDSREETGMLVPKGLSITVRSFPVLRKFYSGIEQALQFRFPSFSLAGKVVRGVTEAFNDQNGEGFIWSVYENGKTGYDGLNPVESGDFLVVRNNEGTLLYRGFIFKDYNAGFTPYPLNPECGSPAALGYGVQWTQAGWSPDDWALLFFVAEETSYGLCAVDESEYPALLVQWGPLQFIFALWQRMVPNGEPIRETRVYYERNPDKKPL